MEAQNRAPGRGLIAATVAVAAAVVAIWWFVVPQYRPSLAAGESWGLDVSNHQGPNIDWPAAAADGIDFAYIKATEGGDWQDVEFASNWERAIAAGVQVGAYHFFTLCTPAETQAANFLSAIPTGGSLPPAIDIEFEGNCAEPPSQQMIADEVEKMISLVRQGTGQEPMMYVMGGFEYLDDEVLPGLPRWERSLWRAPSTNDWTVWQFSYRSAVEGVPGPVDLNVFRQQAQPQR